MVLEAQRFKKHTWIEKDNGFEAGEFRVVYLSLFERLDYFI